MDEDNPISKVGREECSGFLCVSWGCEYVERWGGREGRGERIVLISTWDQAVRVAYASTELPRSTTKIPIVAVIRLINS